MVLVSRGDLDSLNLRVVQLGLVEFVPFAPTTKMGVRFPAFRVQISPSIDQYPLDPSGKTNSSLWKITTFHGKINYKWPFSIAMLV